MTMESLGNNSIERLRSIVSRYENLDREIDEHKDHIKDLRSDQKDLVTEAVSAGFDKKALLALIAKRRKDAAEVEELETLVAIYERALGDYKTTPLGEAAIRAVA